MIRSTVSLPAIPGQTIQDDTLNSISMTRFPHKSHFASLGSGVIGLKESSAAHIGPSPTQIKAEGEVIFPSIYGDMCHTRKQPTWLVFEKDNLVFDAYFEKSASETSDNPESIEEAKILFFLEDGTLKAVQHGGKVLVGPMRVPLPAQPDNYYDLIDLNVGHVIQMAGYKFHLIDCDKYTRDFLLRIGIVVSPKIELPGKMRKGVRRLEPVSRMAEAKHYRVGKMVKAITNPQYDKTRLAFEGYWDDRRGREGYVHSIALLFYLIDDTIQLTDTTDPLRPELVLTRTKVPTKFRHLASIGQDETVNMLNVITKGRNNIYGIPDVLDPQDPPTRFYNEKDLIVGATLNIFGKEIVLTSCNKFTQDYYRTKYGVDNFDPPPDIPPIDRGQVRPEDLIPDPELPPYNGYGTFEDSEINCRRIVLTGNEVKSFVDYFQKGPEGIEKRVLTFKCQLLSQWKNDRERVLMLKYCVFDKSIAVQELEPDPQLIISRRNVIKDGQDIYTITTRPKTYENEDMYIGNILNLEGNVIKLLEADEYTLRYMENNCEDFPQANPRLIIEKLAQYMHNTKDYSFFNALKKQKTMSHEEFHQLLVKHACFLNPHEILMLERKYRRPAGEFIYNIHTLQRQLQDFLKKHFFSDFGKLKSLFLLRDYDKSGLLDKKTCALILRSCVKQITDSIAAQLMERFTDENHDSKVNYQGLVDFMDYSKNPVIPADPVDLTRELTWTQLHRHSRLKASPGVDATGLFDALVVERSKLDFTKKDRDQEESEPSKAFEENTPPKCGNK